jgi:tRNA-dihydrouridine synthase
MIGRASFWNPWCFIPWWYKPSLWEILDMMIFHTEKSILSKWEKKACLDMRKHLVQYLKWFPWVSLYRKRLVMIENIDELKKILEEIRQEVGSL